MNWEILFSLFTVYVLIISKEFCPLVPATSTQRRYLPERQMLLEKYCRMFSFHIVSWNKKSSFWIIESYRLEKTIKVIDSNCKWTEAVLSLRNQWQSGAQLLIKDTKHESILPNMGEKEDKYFNVLHYRQTVKKEDLSSSNFVSQLLTFRYSPY